MRALLKVKQPTQGMGYLVALTFPFRDNPLSRVRAHFEQLRRITMPPEAQTLAPFT